MIAELNLTRSEVVGRAKILKNISAIVPIRDIVLHWVQIISAFGIFYLFPSWWLYIPLILFISARQYGLAILLHDAQHTLFHRNKTINRWLGTWLISAPLGTNFESSQRSHLDHHYHLGERDEDPDYALYCFGEPSPKQSTGQIFLSFIWRIIGGKILSILEKSESSVASHGKGSGTPRSRPAGLVYWAYGFALRFWSVILVQSVFLVIFTLAFGWYGYFVLWLFPLATLASFYNDFRIFCEHSLVGRDTLEKEERMISFISNPVERFFIAPNHMNYHAEHHSFPFVPHNNLPELRRAIEACPELNDRIEWRRSYFGHLFAYIKGFKNSRQGIASAAARKEAGPVAL
jgi:fatty acid desaturase